MIIESLLMISLTNEPWLKKENLNFLLTRIKAGVRGKPSYGSIKLQFKAGARFPCLFPANLDAFALWPPLFQVKIGE